MYNFRTDLADERRDIYRKANNIEDEVSGVETEEEQKENVKITRVKITNEEGEQAIGKPKGNYITIDIKKLNIASEDEIQKASKILTDELKRLYEIHIAPQDEILVVGLGNVYVTADALGPKVIDDLDVTRHILEYLPQFFDKNTRSVCGIAPGVLGTTGIETQEILKGIVDNVKPKLVVVIDSLASRSIDRISSTIQVADTGIIPGAGVGNTRKEISKETLGIPVIAIGVPTVVEAATIAADSLDLFIDKMQQDGKSNEYLNNLKDEDKYSMIKESLLPGDYNFIVTPKEIDELIENMSSVVARGINYSV